MKITQKIAALAFVMVGFAATANAQETVEATATANATIVTPISIEWVADMHFGEIVATADGGTVVLGTDGQRNEIGVQLAATTGTVNAASFKVSGSDGYAYSLTLPVDGYEIKTGAGEATEIMTIGTWTSNYTGALTGGTETFEVGATLNILPNQTAGVYIGDTPFEVSVVYN